LPVLNISTIKDIFHCPNGGVDLDDIFNPPAAELYCTFYSNICDYVENRVKPGNNRSKANDDELS